jgi:acetyl esterase
VAAVRDITIDGTVPARVYRPLEPAAGEPGCALWLHGGGWIMGDLDGFDHVCRALANAGGHTVVSVDYRLAPEHPFPAGLDDARRALAWARGAGATELGHDPGRVAIGGDSAGGNLAAVAARDGGARLQLLVYPVTDGVLDTRRTARERRDRCSPAGRWSPAGRRTSRPGPAGSRRLAAAGRP